MPARNSVKQYLENSYYHIYNRGVAKQEIFRDKQDYSVFLSYLKTYLIPQKNILPKKRLKNYSKEITLLCYFLMPNHFHLLIKQKSQNAINQFMQSLCTKYTIYFNRKYKRIGPLFQGRYKAVLVETDEQLLHLSRYIHQNLTRSDLVTRSDLTLETDYSSRKNYIGSVKQEWVKTDEILSQFSTKNGINSYKAFMGEKFSDMSPIIKILLD
jgi:putative transposase